MTKLVASLETLKNAQNIINNLDYSHADDELKLIYTAIKALAVENLIMQGEDYVKLETVFERLNDIKESLDNELCPLVCYSTGEPIDPYVIDPYLHCHGQEKLFLETYGDNYVQKVVLIKEKVMIFLTEDSAKDLTIND